MTLPYVLVNGPGETPDADKLMANYYWLLAMLKGTFIINGGMEAWAGGTALTNPADGDPLSDSWELEKGGTLSADADVVAQTGAAVDSGLYAMEVRLNTAGSSNSYLRIVQSASEPTRFSGQTVVFGVMVRGNAANKVRLSVTDGATVAYSPYHSGNGEYEMLQVSLACQEVPTEITVKIEITSDFDSDEVQIDSAYLYAIDAGMSETAKGFLEYFGPDQGGALVIGSIAVNTLAFTGQPTAPSSPTPGTVYFNSSDNQFYGWNGTDWVVLG